MTTGDERSGYDAPAHAPEPVDLPEAGPAHDEAPAATELPEAPAIASASPVEEAEPALEPAQGELPVDPGPEAVEGLPPASPFEEPVETTAFAEPPAWEPAAAAVPAAPAASEPAPAADPARSPDPAPATVATPPGSEPDAVLPPAADLPLAAAPEVDPSPAYAEQEAEPAVAPRSRGALVPVLAGLVVVLAGLSGYLGWEAHRTSGPAPVVKTRDDAVASAREAARLVFSYDYRHLAKDFAAGKAVTTGEFSKEYDRTTAKLTDDFAPRYKAVVSADVSASSVVRASGDEVVCLVFVNQVSTSTLVTTPKVTQSRLEMTMRRGDDGRWRVAKIDAL